MLDIILESFETRPEQHHLFISLLKSYMPNGNIICEILGYKYRYFSDAQTPSSLYTITALLLQSELIHLNDIYSWVSCEHISLTSWLKYSPFSFILLQLNPPDRELQTDWQTELDEAKEYVRKLNVISTNKDKEMDIDNEKDEFEVNSV